MHSLIKNYFDNLVAYHESFALEWMIETVGRNPNLKTLMASDEIESLRKRIVFPGALKEILKACLNGQVPLEEMEALVDDMPSGWERAKIMEVIEGLKLKEGA